MDTPIGAGLDSSIDLVPFRSRIDIATQDAVEHE
jgi:hypothetical protein